MRLPVVSCLLANGDVVLLPGASLFVINAEGTRCIQISGETMVNHRVGGCPKTWP
jgi:urease accessory protein UreE